MQKYVPSYGDQPNDVQHVVKCPLIFFILSSRLRVFSIIDGYFSDFRDKFRGYHVRLPTSCAQTLGSDIRIRNDCPQSLVPSIAMKHQSSCVSVLQCGVILFIEKLISAIGYTCYRGYSRRRYVIKKSCTELESHLETKCEKEFCAHISKA